MMPRFDIVVSTQNNHYVEWQAMLFHFSCLRQMGQAPIVVVHKGDEPLLAGFRRIREAGGSVQTAPDFAYLHGVFYPPRNTAGTLQCVDSDADYLVLCDPDFVFVRPLPLQAYALADSQITFDQLKYLHLDDEVYRPILERVAPCAGVPPEVLRQRPINGGVPHIIPTKLKTALSEDWLDCMRLFPSAGSDSAPEADVMTTLPWLTTMWGLVLAVHRLSLEPVMTCFCRSNFEGHESLRDDCARAPRLIHYCYAEQAFDKRRYMDQHGARHQVWKLAAPEGSVHGEVCAQLRAARRFYSAAGRW